MCNTVRTCVVLARQNSTTSDNTSTNISSGSILELNNKVFQKEIFTQDTSRTDCSTKTGIQQLILCNANLMQC